MNTVSSRAGERLDAASGRWNDSEVICEVNFLQQACRPVFEVTGGLIHLLCAAPICCDP
jgi:hypothetical protein